MLGNPYFISLPNKTKSGNALVLGLSYAGVNHAGTISDDKSNSWRLATSVTDGQHTTAIFYALNIAGGTQRITVTFDTAVYNFQAMASEFYNVALSNALDGTASGTGMAPTVSASSMTTSTAGDLIYSYGFDTNVDNTVSGFTPDTGATLLGADIQQGLIAQYSVQSQAGSVQPKFGVTGGSNSFNVAAIALKPAAAGSAPSGIRIVHVYHVLYYRFGESLQFPATGDLLVCATAFAPSQVNITSMSTNLANTWIRALSAQTEAPQIWYAPNASTNSSMRISPGASGYAVSLVFYDVAGAATNPYDTAAGLPINSVSNTDNSMLIGVPVITPSTTNGLVFAFMSNGMGPTVGMRNSDQVLDTITYGGEVDRDAMDNADGYAHYFNPAASAVSFDWLMNSSGLPETSTAVAIAFKSTTP